MKFDQRQIRPTPENKTKKKNKCIYNAGRMNRSGETNCCPTRHLSGECTNGRIKDTRVRIKALGALHILKSPEELVCVRRQLPVWSGRGEAANSTGSH